MSQISCKIQLTEVQLEIIIKTLFRTALLLKYTQGSEKKFKYYSKLINKFKVIPKEELDKYEGFSYNLTYKDLRELKSILLERISVVNKLLPKYQGDLAKEPGIKQLLKQYRDIYDQLV